MNNIEIASDVEMSACARAAEITTIIATAIIRSTVAQKPIEREVGLGFLPDQSVHTTPF